MLGRETYDLREMTRALIVQITNQTHHTLRTKKFQFDSGVLRKSTNAEIRPNSIAAYSFSNRQGSWMTGLSGEMYLEGGGKDVCIGFSNPYSGGYKGYTTVARRLKPEDWTSWYEMDDTHPQSSYHVKTTYDTTTNPPLYSVFLRNW